MGVMSHILCIPMLLPCMLASHRSCHDCNEDTPLFSCYLHGQLATTPNIFCVRTGSHPACTRQAVMMEWQRPWRLCFASTGSTPGEGLHRSLLDAHGGLPSHKASLPFSDPQPQPFTAFVWGLW